MAQGIAHAGQGVQSPKSRAPKIAALRAMK
jgi:hypothetical protein